MHENNYPEVLIGIRGALRSGKDTVGDYLVQYLKQEPYVNYVLRRGFADNLKDVVALIFGFDNDYVYTNEFKKNKTHVCRPNLDNIDNKKEYLLTGRELLQYFGTEVCRTMDYDCWARSTVNYFRDNQISIGIIPDVRFYNEVNIIRERCPNSFIIKVERSGFKGDRHQSERDLDKFDDDDFVISNNGSLEDLKNESERIAQIILERIKN